LSDHAQNFAGKSGGNEHKGPAPSEEQKREGGPEKSAGMREKFGGRENSIFPF